MNQPRTLSRLRLCLTATVTALSIGLTAFPAHAAWERSDERSGGTVNGSGRAQVYRDGGRWGLKGFAQDDAADGYCTETWVDWTTAPHRHYDPYVFRRCSTGSGVWSDLIPEADREQRNINGVKFAVCRLNVARGSDHYLNRAQCQDESGNFAEWPNAYDNETDAQLKDKVHVIKFN